MSWVDNTLACPINPSSLHYFLSVCKQEVFFIMAEIKKLSTGKWFARHVWTENSKRHSKSKKTFRTKREASGWLTQQKAKTDQGINIEKDMVFAKFFDKWVERYKEPKVSSVTIQHYYNVSKHLTAYFGNRKIKSIHIDDYQDFINQYGREHAPASVKKLNSIVRACVKFAIYNDYILKDFTQNVSLTANQDKTVKVDYLNQAEIKKLVDRLKQDLPSKRRYTSKYMILLAVYTGMRLSEIQSLTWNDINLKDSTISITKSWNSRTSEFKPVKTASSRRVIKVNRSILKIILALKYGAHSNMIFMNQFGRIPTSNAVNKTLRSLLDELGIHRQGFHFHSLRHSHVALLLADGIDIYTISKRLGHSNTTTRSLCLLN